MRYGRGKPCSESLPCCSNREKVDNLPFCLVPLPRHSAAQLFIFCRRILHRSPLSNVSLSPLAPCVRCLSAARDERSWLLDQHMNTRVTLGFRLRSWRKDITGQVYIHLFDRVYNLEKSSTEPPETSRQS